MIAKKNKYHKATAKLKCSILEDEGVKLAAGFYNFVGFDTPEVVRLSNSSGYNFCVNRHMVEIPSSRRKAS